MTITGAEQTIVTHLDEAWREDVLQEAADELFSGDRTTLNLIGGRFFISESEVAVLQFEEAIVADGDAKDVRRKM